MSKSTLDQVLLSREQMKNEFESATESSRAALSAISGRLVLKTKKETAKIRRDEELAAQKRAAQIAMGQAEQGISLEQSRLSFEKAERNREEQKRRADRSLAEQERRAVRSMEANLQADRRREAMEMLSLGLYDPSFSADLGFSDGVVKEFAQKKNAEFQQKQAAKNAAAKAKAEYEASLKAIEEAKKKLAGAKSKAAWYEEKIAAAVKGYKGEAEDADAAKEAVLEGVKPDIGVNKSTREYYHKVKRKMAAAYADMAAYYDRYLTEQIRAKEDAGKRLSELEQSYKEKYQNTATYALNTYKNHMAEAIEAADVEKYNNAFSVYTQVLEAYMAKTDSAARSIFTTTDAKRQKLERLTEEERKEVQAQISAVEEMISSIDRELKTVDFSVDQQDALEEMKGDFERILSALKIEDAYGADYEENAEDYESRREFLEMDEQYYAYSVEELEEFHAKEISTLKGELEQIEQRMGGYERGRLQYTDQYRTDAERKKEIEALITDKNDDKKGLAGYIKTRKTNEKNDADYEAILMEARNAFGAASDAESISAYASSVRDETKEWKEYAAELEKFNEWSYDERLEYGKQLDYIVEEYDESGEVIGWGYRFGNGTVLPLTTKTNKEWLALYDDAHENIDARSAKERDITAAYHREVMNFAEEMIPTEELEEKAGKFSLEGFHEIAEEYKHGGKFFDGYYKDYESDVEGFAAGDYGFFEKEQAERVLALLAAGETELAFSYYANAREEALLAEADSLNDWWAGTKGAFSGLTRFITQGGYMIENALSGSYERMAGTLGTASHQVTMEKLDQMGFGGEALELIYMGGYTIFDMVPAVVMGVAGNAVAPGLGSAAASGYIFAKSMATTYTEDIAAGKRADEALTHGVLSGAAEVAMEKLLSGLPGITSKNGLFTKLKDGLGKLATTKGAQTAIKYASSMGAEGFEEFLQEVISPYLSKVAADLNGIEGAELEEIDWEEAGRSFLLGAITGGAFSVAYAPFENRAMEIAAARTLQVGEVTELIDIGAQLENKTALKIKEAMQNQQPRYKGAEGLAAFVSEKDIVNVQKSIRSRRVKGAAKTLSTMIEANMEGADPAEIKRAKAIFRKVLTAQTLTLEEASAIAKDERLLAILEGMMGEQLLGKDLSPRQVALLARLASFTDENGKVSKARLALFKDAFGEFDAKTIEKILRYDTLVSFANNPVHFEGIEGELSAEENEAVEAMSLLGESTGLHFLVTEKHKTGDYLASGLMAVNRADLHRGVYYAIGYKSYYMALQLDLELGEKIKEFLISKAKRMMGEEGYAEEIETICKQSALRGKELKPESAEDELCARYFPAILWQGAKKTVESLAEEDIEAASHLRRVLGTVLSYMKEEMRGRSFGKRVETEERFRYNVVKNVSLEEDNNAKGTGNSSISSLQEGWDDLESGSRRRTEEGRGFAPNSGKEFGNSNESLFDDAGRSEGGYYEDSEGRRYSGGLEEELAESAIRDEEGNLLALYHFTPEETFLEFAKGDIGFHFGTIEQSFGAAVGVQAADRGRIFRVYLNIKNPLYLDYDLGDWNANGYLPLVLFEEGVITEQERDEIIALDEQWAAAGNMNGYDSAPAKRLREILMAHGIDGIAYKNENEGVGYSYIAFSDDQIIKTDISHIDSSEGGISEDFANSVFYEAEELYDQLGEVIKQDRANRYGWKNGEDTTKSDPLFDEIVSTLHINDDSSVIGSQEKFVGTENMEKAGIKIDGSVANYGINIERNKRVAIEQKRADRRIRDYKKRNKITPQEEQIAKDLSAGEITFEEAEGIEGIQYKKVKRLAALITERQGLEKSEIKRTFMAIKEGLVDYAQEDAAKLIHREGFAGAAQSIAQMPISTGFETPRRVFQLFFGLQNGAEVFARWYKPIEENNRNKNLFIGRHLEIVREKLQGKWNKAEREVAQMMIEAQLYDDAIADERMGIAYRNAVKAVYEQEMTPAEAMQEFGLRDFDRLIQCVNAYEIKVRAQEIIDKKKIDIEKLKPAMDAVREEYAILYDALNDFLVAHGMEPIPFIRYYTPHMQIDSTLDKFRDAIRRIGTQEGISSVPVEIAGKTHEYRPNRKWNPHMKERTGTETDYDLLVSFQAYLNYFSNVIFHTDDIMRLRALEKAVRIEFSKESIKDRYSAARKASRGTIEEQNQFLREVGEISGKTVLSAEDAATKITEFMDRLDEELLSEKGATRFVTWLQDMANIRAGKQSAFDRGWEAMLEREGLAAFTKYFGRLKAGKVAGSISSLLKQPLQLVAAISKCGVRYSSRALFDVAVNWKENVAFADEIALLVGKRDMNPLVESAWSRVSSAIGAPMQWVDYMTSLTVAKAAYKKGIDMGMDDQTAKQYANEFATKVMGSRQNAEKPRAFHAKNPMLQAITAFAVEAHNGVQNIIFDTVAEFAQIKRTLGPKEAMKYIVKGLMLYFTLAFFGNRAEDELMNQTPIPFDIIGILTQGIAAGNEQTAREFWMETIDNVCEDLGGERVFETEKKKQDFDVKAMFGMIGEEMLDDFIIPSNVLSTLGITGTSLFNDVPLSLRQVWEDGSAMLKDPTWENAGELMIDIIAALPMPLANQIRKSAQGAWTISDGGNYKTNSKGERQLLYPVTGWWDQAKTAVFGRYASYDAQKYFDTNEKPLSVKQTVIYDDLLASGVDAQTAYDTMLELRKAINDKGSEDRDAQRKYIDSLPMTNDQKMILFRYTLSDSKNARESVEALFAVGVSSGDIMEAYNEYREINADETLEKEKDKATEFAYFLDQVVEDPKHRKMIKQAKGFTYGDFDIVPAEEYENMTEGGVSFDDAYEVYFAVSDLEPEGDKETVSTVAKYSAIEKCGLSDESAKMALLTYATESDERRMMLSFEEDVTAKQFVAVKENLEIANEAAGKSGASNARIRAAIDSTDGLTLRQQAILWQLFTSSTSAKNNPFSVSIGWETVAQIEAYKKAHED